MMTDRRRNRDAAPSEALGGAARQSSLREHNLGVLAQAIFASELPPSRADVAASTGMTRSTVSRLTEDLLAAGIIVEQTPGSDRRPGRPAVPLAPAGRSIVGLGLEVNVDFMAGRVVDLTGKLLLEETVRGDFAGSDPARVLPRLGDLAGRLLRDASATDLTVAGAYLAIPGLVDTEGGRLLLAPNLGWENIRPQDHMGADVWPEGTELHLDNDANLAGYGLAVERPGRVATSSTFLYVTGDIGVGAAILARGRLVRGQHGWAGEIGHIAVEPNGPQCHCGGRGCLERYAGKHTILEAAELPLTATGEELAAAAARGYGAPKVAIERAAWALGIALSNVVNVIDVPEIILGAGFRPLFEQLRPGVEEQLRVRVLSAPWSRVSLRPGPDDTAPAATGGALRALASVVEQPAAWVPD